MEPSDGVRGEGWNGVIGRSGDMMRRDPPTTAIGEGVRSGARAPGPARWPKLAGCAGTLGRWLGVSVGRGVVIAAVMLAGARSSCAIGVPRGWVLAKFEDRTFGSEGKLDVRGRGIGSSETRWTGGSDARTEGGGFVRATPRGPLTGLPGRGISIAGSRENGTSTDSEESGSSAVRLEDPPGSGLDTRGGNGAFGLLVGMARAPVGGRCDAGPRTSMREDSLPPS